MESCFRYSIAVGCITSLEGDKNNSSGPRCLTLGRICPRQSTIILFWRRSTKKEMNLSFRQTRRERSGHAFPAGFCHATEQLSSVTFMVISQPTPDLTPD